MSWMLRKKQKALKSETKTRSKPVASEPVFSQASGSYKVMNAAVRMDMEYLKSIADHGKRVPVKAKLLDKYRDYLAKFMRDEDHQNDVLYLNMIWAADAGQYDWMLELADYAVNTEQKAAQPWFNRPPAAAIAFTILQTAEQQYAKDYTLPDVFNALFKRLTGDDAWDVTSITQAHYHRLMGLQAIEQGEFDQALEYLITADRLKHDIGVKTRIKTLKEGTEAQKQALKKAKKKD